MRTLALVVALLSASIVEAKDVESTRSLALTYGALSAIDLGVTEYGISRGILREANPLMKHRAVRVSGLVATAALSTWVTQELQRDGHHSAAKWLKRGTIAARVLTVAWVVKEMNRPPR